MKISDNTSISMPMRNLIAIIGAVAVGTMAYFGVIERLNKIETNFLCIYHFDTIFWSIFRKRLFKHKKI